MHFPKSHSFEEKIKSLSERLKHFARQENNYVRYVDTKVKSENLLFNLSLLISNIILNLDFIDRSKDAFETIIDQYNRENNTLLTFNDFENSYWIRMVRGEIAIPSVVHSFILSVNRKEKESKETKIPEGKIHLTRCLQLYHQRCFVNSKPTISLEKLNEIIRTQSTPFLSIAFLEQRDIIKYNTSKNCFTWQDNEYVRHLRNEIAATLWLLVGGEKATKKDFAKFFKLIYGSGIWVDNLNGYLSYQSTTRICDFAASFLQAETDLQQSNDEFLKMWLDSASYLHININSDIPDVKFNYETAYDFLESVDYNKWGFREVLGHQEIRSYCYLLLRLIIDNDPKHPVAYQSVANILKDTKLAPLIWILYEELQRHYPNLIPYLLTDSELIPIAFKLVGNIEINPVFLSEQSNNEARIKDSNQLKQKLWLEMFEFTLDNIASIQNIEEEHGIILAKVLIEAANKIFTSNNNNPYDSINHISLKKRYEEALKMLSTKRIIKGNVYPKPAINPRLIFMLLPGISKYLKEKVLNQRPWHNEYIHIQSGLFDLSIEMLRLANLRRPKSEISDEQREIIKAVSSELVSLLKHQLIHFYTVVSIDVQTYIPTSIKKRVAQRGVNDFGFEIVDWSYLFLQFENEGILETINDKFIGSLDFETGESKYFDLNKEQSEKIKLYLKSLMLAFISVNQKKNIYQIDGLPVNSVLTKLESWIKYFALRYSVDNLTESRIDVFSDRFKMFGYDMYHQQLTSLLYRSVNYFQDSEPSKFIKDFFANSVDTGRMLTAINILDSKELTDIISDRIKEVRIEEFIESSFTTTELQFALIEAINSDKHWELAKPLIERIQNHYQQVQHRDANTEYILYEVSLLLAFKEKDFNKIVDMPVPEMTVYYQADSQKTERLKKFFIALFRIYNEKKYEVAIPILKSLLSEDAKNIRYAFHLYRAETLNAITGV